MALYNFGWWKSTFPLRHPDTSRQWVGENLVVRTGAVWLMLDTTSYSCCGCSGMQSHSSPQDGLKAISLIPKPKGEHTSRPSLLKHTSLINPRPMFGSSTKWINLLLFSMIFCPDWSMSCLFCRIIIHVLSEIWELERMMNVTDCRSLSLGLSERIEGMATDKRFEVEGCALRESDGDAPSSCTLPLDGRSDTPRLLEDSHSRSSWELMAGALTSGDRVGLDEEDSTVLTDSTNDGLLVWKCSLDPCSDGVGTAVDHAWVPLLVLVPDRESLRPACALSAPRHVRLSSPEVHDPAWTVLQAAHEVSASSSFFSFSSSFSGRVCISCTQVHCKIKSFSLKGIL